MTKLPAADPHNRLWLRALLAALGTTFVSASPIILGKVAGLPSLLMLFPKTVQIITIATLPFLLGFISLVVSLVGNSRSSPPRLGYLLSVTTVIGGIALIALLGVYVKGVTRIETGDGTIHTFVTGFGERPAMCCPSSTKVISNEECIRKVITFSDEAIHTCFGDSRIQNVEIMLTMLYLMLFGAVAIGAAIVSWSNRRPTGLRNKPKSSPREQDMQQTLTNRS